MLSALLCATLCVYQYEDQLVRQLSEEHVDVPDKTTNFFPHVIL